MNIQITETYVSFEIAKLLKEKGFNEKCHSAWLYNPRENNSEYFVEYLAKGIKNNTELEQFNEPDTDWAYSAPTLQMAMKWLREVHKIDICVCRELEVCSNGVYMDTIRDAVIDLSYEEVAELAIKYCLTNII